MSSLTHHIARRGFEATHGALNFTDGGLKEIAIPFHVALVLGITATLFLCSLFAVRPFTVSL